MTRNIQDVLGMGDRLDRKYPAYLCALSDGWALLDLPSSERIMLGMHMQRFRR